MSISYIWNKLFKKLGGRSIRNSTIPPKAYVNSGSNIFETTLGDYSYCGYDCWVISCDIGKFCSISNQVRIGGPSHTVDWVSMSPVFHAKKNVLNKYFKNDFSYNPYVKTVIGNDVWIGENAIIKAGVKIADGAVIGAGSVLTKDVGPYEIWAGNPAKLIKKRFDDKTISALLDIKWWDFSDDKLKDFSNYINDPNNAIKKFGGTE